MKTLRTFDQWLFGYGSPAAMGLFRAALGGVALIDLALVLPDFNEWYTETGYVPTGQLQIWSGGFDFFSPLSHITDARVTAVFYALTMLAAFFTSIGLFTRVSSIALLVGVVSIHHRCPDILHSGDSLMRVMLFYLALAPCGLAFSVDRRIAIAQGASPQQSVSLWPQRMMQVQLAVMYVTTVWHKSFGATWLDGTATHYPLNLAEFDRFSVPAWFDAQPMLAISTWGTLLVELALGTLVFSKVFRKPVVIAGLVLHAGIEYQFNIPMFALIVTSCYIVYYEGEEVDAWIKKVGDRLKVRSSVKMEDAQG